MKLTEIYQQLAAQYGDPAGGEQVHAFSDKGNPHSYIEFYESQFEPLRDRARILEIGVKTGGSLLLWSRYFETYRIVGVDLSPTWSAVRPFQAELEANPAVELIWSQDSTQPFAVEGNFDFVIDDGAHDIDTQWRTFLNCWHLVAPGGSYYIEDIESNHNSHELVRRLKRELTDTATVTRFLGHVHRRADDQIIQIQRR
jgi:predicted O-methyltransferase YrrM